MESKQKKKKKRDNCKKCARVKVVRNNLFHIFKSNTQKTDIKKYVNSRSLCGVIFYGNGKQGYEIKFDDLPTRDQLVYVRRMDIITILEKDDDEVEWDHYNLNLGTIMKCKEKDDLQVKLTNACCDMYDDKILSATLFKMIFN